MVNKFEEETNDFDEQDEGWDDWINNEEVDDDEPVQSSPEVISKMSREEANKLLGNEEYLKPVLDNDTLLYSFDEEDEVPASNTIESTNEISGLLKKLAESEERAEVAEMKASQISDAFDQYKEMVKATFLDPKMSGESSNVNLDSDYYFESYAGIEIHETMLKDTIRTDAYRNFIVGNPEFFKGKIVLDVGCGTGILSMFAAKSGAKHVYSVDNSSIIKKAKKIIFDNGFADKITFVEGAIEEIELPVSTVDVIISEWMGYFLLYESMLDSVFIARDRFLAPDGIMAPSQSDIIISAIDDEEWLYDRFNYWDQVYGFDMSVIKLKFTEEAHIDIFSHEKVISDQTVITSINTNVAKTSSLDFESNFKLQILKSGYVTAFLGWFDIVFEGENAQTVKFTTSPFGLATHWKQTAFVLDKQLKVETNDMIDGWIECVKSKSNHRELIVTLKFVVVGKTEIFQQVFNVR
ncbi:hypothetical protein HK096_010720 [Nowakowskiella sp. JEL0078]|nr:hypothetical protein HK096_010720 [Nowakowskiella sp. JEL0078]